MRLKRWLAAALLLAGCKQPTPGATVTCSPPECAYTTPLALVAEVDPPAMGRYVHQEFTSLTIDAKTGLFTLALDSPVTLSGVVKVAGLGNAKALQATIVATRASRISGRPDVYYQAASDPSTGAYRLMVSPNVGGEQYVVRVTPNDPTAVPPMQQMVSATADQSVDFNYPDPLTLPELHGLVRDSLQTPVAGMQLQAIDPTSGIVLSTTVVSDVTGAYSLRLLSTPPPVVKLTATPSPMTTPAGGTVTLTPTLSRSVAIAAMPSAASSVEANLQLPALPAPARTTYAIAGVGPSGAPTPVVGATCTFTADVSDPNSADGVAATYSTSAVSDGDGNATVQLLPAVNANRSYQVTVTPDVSSSFQALTTAVDVAPQGGYGQALSLSLRPLLSGLVLDPESQPLDNVMIVPTAATLGQTPTAAGTPRIVTVPTAAPQGSTSTDGRFALRLDAQIWDVGLIPPVATMLPRLWITGTNVTTNTEINVTVPRGVMVHGVVRGSGGGAIALADVRLFTVAAANSNCANNQDFSCLAPARLRAEGPTDASGTVGIILPNKPVD